MEQPDRRAAHALRTMDRPDVRALRSALDRVERNFKDLIEVQDEEIERLRRMVVQVVSAYRAVVLAKWDSDVRVRKLTDTLDEMCLEADAILYEQDLKPKARPARRRDNG